MKKLTLTLLIFVIVAKINTFGQFASYHFEEVEAFSFNWGNGEEATTSNSFFEIDEEKFGYSHLNIQKEDGRTFLVNSKNDVAEYFNYTLADRPVDVVTVNSGVIFVSTKNGIYNLETGEMLSGIEGFITGTNGNIRMDYDPVLNRLYFAGGKVEGFGFRDFESGMITFYGYLDEFPDYAVNDIEVVDGDVYIGAGELWVYDVASEDFGLIEDVPSFISVGGIDELPDGSVFVGGADLSNQNILVWIKNGTYQNEYALSGVPFFYNGEYFLSGSAGPADDGYFHYFDPVTGITSPVVASGVSLVNGGVYTTLVNSEFWFYKPYDITPNVMGVDGYYGYPVVILTDDEVVGIHDTPAISFTIYPNPATEWVKVEGLDPMGPIWMTDMLGHNVEITLISENTVDVSSLPSGVYLLNGQRLVIQR
ncbi:T9SS type A sorting domain-containing protein [Candidatus Nomurabacteria bacterium]|nr:T9SS type A sorting domain-containing protein [Candidatus Nomurabacteria bacterium]